MKLKANYHTHTVFCDGADTPEDVVLAAIGKGFTHLGFSGHMDYFAHVDAPRYFAELRRLEEKYAGRIEILHGLELDSIYKDPAQAEAEYTIGSTHYLDVPPVDGEYLSVDSSPENLKRLADIYFGGDYYKLSRAYYELAAQAVERMHPTFIGHFDLVTRFNDLPAAQGGQYLDEDDARYYMPALEAMEQLVRQGAVFEVNCGALNRGYKRHAYPCPRLLRALRGFGGEIVISSDAHRKELLDGGFDIALETARECGFDHVNILTRRGDGADKRPAPRGLFWQTVPIRE